MTKELIDSFRKDGLKYRLQRDEDGLWSVRTDKQVFSGTEAGAVEFLKAKGIEAVSEPSVPSFEEVEKLTEPATAFDVLHETERALEAIIEPIQTPSGPSVPYVPLEPEPELEVVAVLEEAVEESKTQQAIKEAKEIEIARLTAQIEDLKKDA